ncbi:MAG: hypothetical protein A2044_03460 [Candidatus Firestonebacteria bacterium GWA2_43_8]|nr:MAG: hypothetical protein A2044_03460 [Candidatus Firestonebacteria bacterium GWA2_43_8]
MPEKLNCWEYMKCGDKGCPAFGRKDIFCWATSGNKHCLNGLETAGAFKKCLACEIFERQTGSDSGNGFMGLVNQLYAELEKSEAQNLLFRKISGLVQSTIEIDKTLHIILTCVTAGYGLQFNRAMLFLVSENGDFLEDRMMVAPASKEEAYGVWQEIANLDVSASNLPELINIYEKNFKPAGKKYKPGKILLSLTEKNVFSMCIKERRAVVCDYKYKTLIPEPFLAFWKADYFAVAPIFSGTNVRGVIVADNFVNNKQITNEYLNLLSGFAFHAGLAIQNALLYQNLEIRAKELEETNERLKEAREILMRAEKLAVVGEMAATVAHEMRTPLISIGGFARMVTEKVRDNPENRKHMEIITTEVNRLERIIHDVLDFVRPFELTLTPINVKKVVEEAVVLVETGRKTSGIIKTDIPEKLKPVVADGERIKQVLINLMDNALDAAERTPIMVSARIEHKSFILEVKDEGLRIEAGNLDRVIRPFFTTKKEGLGLGLPIAEKIVKEHKGELMIIPNSTGVIVRVTLPIAE